MKAQYLLFALVAAGAQPAIAARPAGSDGAAAPLARAQDLQRVADAMTAEAGASARRREAVEAIKARIKAMKRPSLPAEAPDCEECSEKASAPAHPDSASQVRNVDCIHCVEQPILA